MSWLVFSARLNSCHDVGFGSLYWGRLPEVLPLFSHIITQSVFLPPSPPYSNHSKIDIPSHHLM